MEKRERYVDRPRPEESVRLYKPRRPEDQRVVENFRRALYDWLRSGAAKAEFEIPSNLDRPCFWSEEDWQRNVRDEMPSEFFVRIAKDLARAYEKPIADVRQQLDGAGGWQLWIVLRLETKQTFAIKF